MTLLTDEPCHDEVYVGVGSSKLSVEVYVRTCDRLLDDASQ